MTEAEIIELFMVSGANALTSFSVYISITVAFLIAAYFVGSALTPFQAATASGLYLIGVTSAFMSQIAYVQMQSELLKSAPANLRDLTLVSGDLWIGFMSIVQIAGILVCLFFMWQVRHAKAD